MGDQLGDAENRGFNPYEYQQQKREAEANASEARAAAELAIVEQWTQRVADAVEATDPVGMSPAALSYRRMAVAALTVLAPEIAKRDAMIQQLRAHLTAEADKLAAQPHRTMTAPEVAAVLRAIVEATR